MIRRLLCWLDLFHSPEGPVSDARYTKPVYYCRHCKTFMLFGPEKGWFIDHGSKYKEA